MQDFAALKVITLNLAHGRKDAWHQALLKRATIQANLDEVVRILQHEQPDVVALQEADAPSLWSGRFHHVAYLSEKTGIPYFVLGEHVRRMRLAYGTALVSRHHLQDATSYRFSPSPPTPLKGMVVGTIQWPGKDDVLLDLVSVHLDFSRKSVRRRQAREIIDRLAGRSRPLVLMGDFNCGFCAKDPTLSMLAGELNLQTHEGTSTGRNQSCRVVKNKIRALSVPLLPVPCLRLGSLSLPHTPKTVCVVRVVRTPFSSRAPSEAEGNVPHEDEHQHDHKQQPQATAGAVAPASAVAPSWQAAHEQHDDNNQQEQTHSQPLSIV